MYFIKKLATVFPKVNVEFLRYYFLKGFFSVYLKKYTLYRH